MTEPTQEQAIATIRAEYRRLHSGTEPDSDTMLLVWAAEQLALVVPWPAPDPVPTEEGDAVAAQHAAQMAALNEDARR